MSDGAAKLKRARQCIRARRGQEALEVAKEAVEELEKAGDKTGAAEATGISLIATAVAGDVSEARSLAGVLLQQGSSDKTVRVAVLRALAEVELFLGKADEALAQARDAERESLEQGEVAGADLWATLAEAHLAEGNGKAALGAASKSLQVATAAGDRQNEAFAWDAVMCARDTLGKYEEALKAAEAALVTYLDLGDLDGKAVTLCRLAKIHNKNHQYQKAIKAGGIAQERFRQSGSTILEEAASAEVVEGLLGMEAKAEALRQARQGQAQLQKAGDKKMAAIAARSVVKAYSADGKYREGVVAAKDAMAVFQDLGDKNNEGLMLCEMARLYARIGQLEQSKEAAAEALLILKDAGNKAGGVTALELLGEAEETKTRLEQEREQQEEVSRLMADLKESLTNRREDDFKEALDKVYKCESISVEDLQAALVPVFERDPAGAQEFWDTNQPGGLSVPKGVDDINDFFEEVEFKSATVHHRQRLYLGFRFGGMGYGPGFRLLKTSYRKGPLSYWAHGHSTLRLKDDHDDWEPYAGWHAGVLDCALQTGASRFQ